MNVKKKPCKQCKELFAPRNSLQKVCSPKCAIEYVQRDNAKKAKKEYYKNDKSHALKAAQEAFNRYIRARDYGKPCISCGTLKASRWDAGHYISVGARPSLRFNEDNCHLQCQKCNTHLSGNLALYRMGLLEKIGETRLSALEGPIEPCRYRIDDLHLVSKTYRDKAKALKKAGDGL
jgi:hypothetical protein